MSSNSKRGERKNEFTRNSPADCSKPSGSEDGGLRRRLIYLLGDRSRFSSHHLDRDLLCFDETWKLPRLDEDRSKFDKEVNPGGDVTFPPRVSSPFSNGLPWQSEVVAARAFSLFEWEARRHEPQASLRTAKIAIIRRILQVERLGEISI